MKDSHEVGIYFDGKWTGNAVFKYRWQARLFHAILNTSMFHAGTRHY